MRKQLLLLFFAGLAVPGGSFCRFSRHSTSDLIRIEQQGKIGYIDRDGKLAIPAVYDNGSDFSEGLAAVREGGYYGYIDLSGRFVILPQFDFAEPFSEGLAAVHADARFFYIDRSGRVAFRCPYITLSSFQHGVAMVGTVGRHWGLINHSGRLILDTIYNVLRDFDEGLAFVDRYVKDGPTLEGIVDTSGHFVVPMGKYASVGYPKHGYCVASDTIGDQIVVDRTGREVLRRPEKHNTRFDQDGFSEGIAPVELYKDWESERPGVSYTSEKAYVGYIDMDQHLLLNDTLVEIALPFFRGRAFIKLRGGRYRLIDDECTALGRTNIFRSTPMVLPIISRLLP